MTTPNPILSMPSDTVLVGFQWLKNGNNLKALFRTGWMIATVD